MPRGCAASRSRRSRSAPGIQIPADSRWVRAAQSALADEFGRPAVLIGSGGSIPVVESLRRILGIDSLLMGFGLNDDQVHSPNEKFEWRCFHHGLRSHARLLDKSWPSEHTLLRAAGLQQPSMPGHSTSALKAGACLAVMGPSGAGQKPVPAHDRRSGSA